MTKGKYEHAEVYNKAKTYQINEIDNLIKVAFDRDANPPQEIDSTVLDRAHADKKALDEVNALEGNASINKELASMLVAMRQDEQRMRRDLAISFATRKQLLLGALKILKHKQAALKIDIEQGV